MDGPVGVATPFFGSTVCGGISTSVSSDQLEAVTAGKGGGALAFFRDGSREDEELLASELDF